MTTAPAEKSSHTPGRVRTVEYDAGYGFAAGGWIARCPRTGAEIMEEGFLWRTRSVARSVVDEHRVCGCGPRCAIALAKASRP